MYGGHGNSFAVEGGVGGQQDQPSHVQGNQLLLAANSKQQQKFVPYSKRIKQNVTPDAEH